MVNNIRVYSILKYAVLYAVFSIIGIMPVLLTGFATRDNIKDAFICEAFGIGEIFTSAVIPAIPDIFVITIIFIGALTFFRPALLRLAIAPRGLFTGIRLTCASVLFFRGDLSAGILFIYLASELLCALLICNSASLSAYYYGKFIGVAGKKHGKLHISSDIIRYSVLYIISILSVFIIHTVKLFLLII